MQKIIAISVPKGGVGKTTTAVNLAAGLAVAERKTLLIDFDPSGGCSEYLGFNNENSNGNFFEVFSFNKSVPQVIHNTKLPYLDFIPLNAASIYKEERLGRLSDNIYLFKNILRGNFLQHYEFIIIDCPPYLKGLTTIAMTAAKSVLIPVRAGQFSLTALDRMFELISWVRSTFNPSLKVEGILLTMYEEKTRAWKKTREELLSGYSNFILNTVIPKNSTISESEFHGKPVILFDVKSNGAMAYLTLAKEIIMRKPLPLEDETEQVKSSSVG